MRNKNNISLVNMILLLLKKKSNIQFMTLIIEWYSKQEQNVNLINFWKYRLNKNLENEKNLKRLFEKLSDI